MPKQLFPYVFSIQQTSNWRHFYLIPIVTGNFVLYKGFMKHASISFFLINTRITTVPSLRRYGELNTCTVLRSEIPSGVCAKLRTVAASNNGHHARNLSYFCLLAPRIHIFGLRAHPARGEPQSTQHHRRGCKNSNVKAVHFIL